MKNVFKFNGFGWLNNPKKKAALLEAIIAEIIFGLLGLAIRAYGWHSLVGIAAPFIALGIAAIAIARHLPKPPTKTH